MEMCTPQSRCRFSLARACRLLRSGVRPLISLTLAVMLVTASASPQSLGSASAPITSPQAKSPETSPPRPDNKRAQNACLSGGREEDAVDWKASYGAYSEATIYGPANKEYP